MSLGVREVHCEYRPVSSIRAQEDEILRRAEEILWSRVCRDSKVLDKPETVRSFLRMRMAGLEREEFHAIWVNGQHAVINVQTLTVGTIDGATVHPREVVKSALHFNASSVIFAHNHPSGIPEPSAADRQLTERLRTALLLVDVRVLDHVVVGVHGVVSFAERGWL